MIGLIGFLGACTDDDTSDTTTTTTAQVETYSYICQDGTFITSRPRQSACSNHGGIKGSTF